MSWATALLSSSLVVGCPDPVPGPSPCVEEPIPEPEIGFDLPGDGLAAERIACRFGPGDTSSETIGGGGSYGLPAGRALPIEHVVVLMLENRSFDHYMSELGHGYDVATNQTNPNGLGEDIGRELETQTLIHHDLNHEWEGTHLQYNGGRLDGFVISNYDSPDGRGTMNYFGESTIPLFYWLARTFATSDRHFSSLLGPTWPNRYFFFAGTAAGRTTTPGFDVRDLEVPEFGLDTIFEQLGDRATVYSPNSPPLTFGMLPLAGTRIRSIEQFESDAAAGTLPAFSFIEPVFSGPLRSDDHPGADILRGQSFVRKIVSAVAHANTWPRVALFVSYDEHGGYYDHVPPPRACEPDDLKPPSHAFDRYGFRVPVFVLSPYVRQAYVSHVVTDHTSITRFVQYCFGLGALTRRDANAWPLLDAFDFDAASFSDFPPGMPATPEPVEAAQ